jgi:hypothetical protein
MNKPTVTFIYHCYFCGVDFGLFIPIQPSCPCCKNEDDVLLITGSGSI